MSLPIALQVGATLLGMSAQSRAASAQALQAQQQARQMEIDRQVAEVQAMQQRNQRIADYNTARSTNNAQFSFQLEGGESSSLAAFEQEQGLTKNSDLAASQFQSFLDQSSRSVASRIEIQRGINASRVGSINSLTMLAQLGADLSKTYTPTSYTPTPYVFIPDPVTPVK